VIFDFFNSLLSPFIPKLAEYFLWLLGIVVGNFVVWRNHWGKVPWDERFKSPLKLFMWLLIFAGIGLLTTDYVAPFLTNFLQTNVSYLTGITSFVLGTFYVWFIWSGNWSITTNYKWVLPAVCYLITVANMYAPWMTGLLPFLLAITHLG